MKAWRLHGLGDMRLEEVPDPEIRAGWVIIKVRVLQISVTEVAALRGHLNPEGIKELLRKHGPTQRFGHELAGEVVDVGQGVSSLKVGDRVALVHGIVPCGQCRFCQMGKRRECSEAISGANIPGGLAEYMARPAQAFVTLPDSIDFHEGACFQPLVAAFDSVDTSGMKSGDTVVVLGYGCLGRGVAQIAKALGASRIIVTARRPVSVELAYKLGADHAINVQETDPVEEVMKLTDGLGAEVVFDTAAGPTTEGLSGTATLDQAFRMARKGGKIAECSLIPDSSQMSLSLLQERELSLIFQDSAHTGMDNAKLDSMVNLVATGAVQLKPAITHILRGLEEIPLAFEIAGNKGKYDAINPAQVVLE